MSLLSLSAISLSFGGPALLDGVSLQIEPGDRLCLMGRNGSGKSTLLKVVAGELTPESGELHRQQGLRIALVSQEVPRTVEGTVFSVVSEGLGEVTQLLAEYHRVAHELSLSSTDGLLENLASLQKDLEARGGWQLHDDVELLLKRFSLSPDADFATLSGGTKRRVMLARALVSSPDILLLDEPTNHLDLDTILWLEEYLQKRVSTLLFITHDRAFARKIGNRVAELDRGRLFCFSCAYDDFVARREELLAAEVTRMAQFDKKLAAEEAWIRQGIKARRTRNEGRVRALQRLREERRSRRERTGTVTMRLQEAERSGALVVEMEDVSFSYGDRRIVSSLTTLITRGDRIGIIGPNGAGKTTLLKLLLGDVEPQSGIIKLGSRREILYFDQLREQLDPDKTVQENVGDGNDTVTINGKSRHIVGYLQDFLFSPERIRTPVRILSGGERNRLLLAKLFIKPCNLLVMDEPTNDLDAETLELLEELLLQFSGTLLLVSHDREFLNNVVTSTMVLKGDGTVREYVGGYDDWQRQSQAEVALVNEARQADTLRREPDKQKPAPERPRKLSFKEAKELDELPARIAAAEAEQADLHRQLGDPAFYRSAGDGVAALNRRLAELDVELAGLYERWEVLESLA